MAEINTIDIDVTTSSVELDLNAVTPTIDLDSGNSAVDIEVATLITDYDALSNKPQINSVELSGNKTLDNLGIQSKITSTNKLDYNLLENTPTIPSGALADLDSIDYTSDYLTNKPTIPTGELANLDEIDYTSNYLINKPTIPSGALANLDEIDYTSNYLINKPNIPTKTSELTNDSDFITTSYHDNIKQDIIDNTLTTENKTIPTAINEVNSLAKQCGKVKSYSNYQELITELNNGVTPKNVFSTDDAIQFATYKILLKNPFTTQGTYTISAQDASSIEYLLMMRCSNDSGKGLGNMIKGQYGSFPNTFTVTEEMVNATYLMVYYNFGYGTISIEQLNNAKIQIEAGSSATNYEERTWDPLYKAGQSFYIQTLEVPDLWVCEKSFKKNTYTYTTDAQFIADTAVAGGCHVGYYKLAQLETQKVDLTDYATKTYVDTADATKQDMLVSGTNIKTINNQSILGSGNITIESGVGNYNELENKPQINSVELVGNKSLSDLGIDIPTKTSDLTNDSGYITNSVNDLTNYYNKTTSDNKYATATALSAEATTRETADNLKQNITDSTLTTTAQTIPTAINEVNSIAKGCNKAKGYTNYSSLITELNSTTIGKNIYDKSEGPSGYYVTGGYVGIASAAEGIVPMLLKPNTTYTLSKMLTSRCVVCVAPSLTIGTAGYRLNEDNTKTTYTFTTDSTNLWLMWIVRNKSLDSSIPIETILASIQIEEGETATEYEDYTITPNYNNGQSFLIQTLEVPDLWIMGKRCYSSTYTYTTDAQFIADTAVSGGCQVGYYMIGQLETLKQDLTNYVRNTDYATYGTGGVFKINNSYGLQMLTGGFLAGFGRSYTDYQNSSNALVISKSTLENVITGKGLVDTDDLATKQDTLVSGTNIKTVNNQSLLGSGNITISGGSSSYTDLTDKPSINDVELTGNKSLEDLGIDIPTKTSDLTNDSNFVSNTDYANSTTAGVVKTGSNFNVGSEGSPYCYTNTYEQYGSSGNNTFISKGTLENVITGKDLVDGTDLATKQDTLVSGTNIKTINDSTILGSGNIDTTQLYICTYGTTTFAEISTALSAGKFPVLEKDGYWFAYAYTSTIYHAFFGHFTESIEYKATCSNENVWALATKALQATEMRVNDYTATSTSWYPSSKALSDGLATKQNITDSSLTTEAQTIPTAINEVNSLAKQCNKAKGYTDYSTLITELNAGTLGKNLYDKNGGPSGYYVTNGKVGIATAAEGIQPILLKPNTTYTVSKMLTSRCVVCTAPSLTIGTAGNRINEDNTKTTFTFTTDETNLWLMWIVRNKNEDASIPIETILASIQIEEGDTATTYEEYSMTPDYNNGQSFLIQTLNVPDLWVIGRRVYSSTYTYTTDDQFITDTAVAGGCQVGYYMIGQLETLKQDLTNYVTNTDYATTTVGGVVKASPTYGTQMTSGYLAGYTRTYDQYQEDENTLLINKGTLENVVTGKGLLSNTDYATSSTAGAIKVTTAYGASMGGTDSAFIQALPQTYSTYNSASSYSFVSKGTLENVITGKGLVNNTDYATTTVGGVIKVSPSLGSQVTSPNGFLAGTTRLYSIYQTDGDSLLISKGTLENVITGKNFVAGSANAYTIWNGTQAEYDAIETKDATTIYIITG